MRRIILFLIFITSLSQSVSYTQTFNLGLRLESFGYSINSLQEKYTKVQIMPLPIFSGYVKAGIIFENKYELELKTGVQIIDPFVGPEYQILFKYGVSKTIFPLITYMLHTNVGNSHTSGGTYDTKFNFIGFGIEAKLKEFFSLDLVCYLPVGKKDLEYQITYNNFNNISTANQMGPMIKLGFIFNIVRF